MTFALHFHDSEVRLAEAQADTLLLRFSAAHVERQGPAGRESGYARSLELALRQARWSGELRDCVGRLAQGRLSIGGTPRAPLPVPCAATAPVHCELLFANGTRLLVDAAALDGRFGGDPCFVESYAC